MPGFQPKTICILGRQPALGLAELESLYGAARVRPLAGHALLDVPAQEIDFRRLGGTIKTARILAERPTVSWKELAAYFTDKVPPFVKDMDEGKFTLGVSLYGFDVPVRQITGCLLEVKNQIRRTGRAVRIVPNKEPALSSAQVLHNKLIHKGSWEILFIKNGARTLIAQTLFVQDIEAYGARDQARPVRDARVGMLPPKLAQIMINLAAGQLEAAAGDKTRVRLLDPFCGSGVILQEALLMGYNVLGTDLDERMVKASRENIRWLFGQYAQLTGGVDIEAADATKYVWPGFSTLVSEVYLGRPLSALPPPAKLKPVINDTDTIIKKFLRNLSPQLKEGRAVCLAVPAWRRPDGGFIRLPLLENLTDMGYTYWDLKTVRHDELVYFREGQVVARQLLRLRKA